MSARLDLRLATTQDFPAIEALWQQVFEDEPEFIQRSLTQFAGMGQVYVAQQQGQLLAQLLAVPCRLQSAKGIYLYALATAPFARGQGVMSHMMRVAEAQEAGKGATFAVLIPASETLYTYYGQRGYTQMLHTRRLALAVKAANQSNVCAAPLNGEQFAQMRSRYAGVPYVDFTPARYQELLTDWYEIGESLYNSGGYAFYQPLPGKNKVLVAELFAQSDEQATAILQAIAAQTGINKMDITLAVGGRLCTGQGARHKAGLIKPLPGADIPQNPYLRFGFDNITDIM